MRKLWAIILSLFLLLSFSFKGYAVDGLQNSDIKDIKITVDSTRMITLSGKLPVSSERPLLVTLWDERKQLRYTNGISSYKAGAFSLTFSPGDCPTGNYTLKIGSEGLGNPYTATIYLPVAVSLYGLKVQLNDTQMLSVSGKLSSGSLKKIIFLVLDSNGIPVYIDNIQGQKDSSFLFHCPMTDQKDGEYTIRLGCEGSEKAFYACFSLGSLSNNSCLSDIELESGTLNQPFDPYQNNYYMIVPAETETVKLRPMAEDLNSMVTIQGQQLNFQTTSAEVQLVGQMTNVQIHVASQDGNEENTYNVKICKGQPIAISEVSAFENDGLVQVTGKTDLEIEGNRFYVIITNPVGDCDYINSTSSRADGTFSFSYKMKSKPAGAYLVRVEGELSPESVETSFLYTPPASEMKPDKERREGGGGGGGATLYSITIGDTEMQNTLLLSTTKAQIGTTITLSVKDPHHASYYEIDEGAGYHVLNGNSFIMPAADVKVKVHLAD